MLKPLLAVMSLLLFFGCSKSDNPAPQNNPATIQGLWYYKADTLNIYQNSALYQTSSLRFNYTASLSFSNDGTGVEYYPGYLLFYFNYNISGKTITLNYPAQTLGYLSITRPLSESGTIQVLTQSDLKLYFDQSFTGNGITTRAVESSYFDK